METIQFSFSVFLWLHSTQMRVPDNILIQKRNFEKLLTFKVFSPIVHSNDVNQLEKEAKAQNKNMCIINYIANNSVIVKPKFLFCYHLINDHNKK